MRGKLENKLGPRMTFKAKVERFGRKNARGFPGFTKTILLKNIIVFSTGEEATDHAWFTVGEMSEFNYVQEGDIIQFDARVKTYWKGYYNERQLIDERKVDYRLSHPTNL